MDTIRMIMFVILYFLLFVSSYSLFSYLLLDKKISKKVSRLLKFLVVIPAYNEEKVIKRTLLSFLFIRYPKNMLHIVVVDDGSTDKTCVKAEEAAKVLRKKGYRVDILRKSNGGKASAINYALKKFFDEDFDCLTILDADSILSPNYFIEASKVLSGNDVWAAIPRVFPARRRSLLEKIQFVEYETTAFARKILAHYGKVNVCPVGSSIKKEVIKKLGFFREDDITEDLEYGLRILKHGGKIDIIWKAAVLTYVPTTFKGLIKQRVRWYYGFVENSMRYLKVFLASFPIFLTLVLFWYNISALILIAYLNLIQFIREFSFQKSIGFDIGYYISRMSLPTFLEVFGDPLYWLIALTLMFFYVTYRISRGRAKSIKEYLYAYLYVAYCWMILAVAQIIALTKIIKGEKKWWR